MRKHNLMVTKKDLKIFTWSSRQTEHSELRPRAVIDDWRSNSAGGTPAFSNWGGALGTATARGGLGS